MGRDIPNMPKLEDPKDIQLFLKQFETDMISFKVPPDQWTTQLRPLLDPKSSEFSRKLAPLIQKDFHLLGKELTRLHGITPAFHGRNWATLKTSPTEDPLQLGPCVKFAWVAWMEDCNDRAAIEERVTIDKFVSLLDPNTAQPSGLETATPRPWRRQVR